MTLAVLQRVLQQLQVVLPLLQVVALLVVPALEVVALLLRLLQPLPKLLVLLCYQLPFRSLDQRSLQLLVLTLELSHSLFKLLPSFLSAFQSVSCLLQFLTKRICDQHLPVELRVALTKFRVHSFVHTLQLLVLFEQFIVLITRLSYFRLLRLLHSLVPSSFSSRK